MNTQSEFETQMNERFAQLPQKVQDAITSADVEAHLRDLAKVEKLHVDQWDLLENEVMMTLLGFQKTEDLKENLRKHVGLTNEAAESLAKNITQIVFEPIRAEMEKVIAQPSTTPQNTEAGKEEAPKAVRAPISTSYTSQTPSHERNTIEGDPYREQLS